MNAEPDRSFPRGLMALRSRNFLLYFTGHFTSQVGTWIEQTAVAWILYELTDSAVLLGLGGLFRAAPMILLALPGGAIADRVRHRRLLAITESIMFAVALTMGVLAVTGRLQFWHLYLLNLASGTLYAFSVPARQALFPALVARDALPSAVTLNSAAARSAAFIGPSIAGLTLAFSGYAAPFFLNAASFVAMLAALAAMRLPAAVHAPQTARLGLRSDMGEGVQFVRRSDLLKAVLMLELLAGLFGHNSAIVTIMARDVLDAGPQGLGALLSALSAGALFGMLLMVVRHTERRGRLILFAGAVYSLLLVGFALSKSLALSMALLFVLGAADGVWGVARNTVVHLAIPDALRGRVMSMVFLVTRGSTPMGQLNSGVFAALIGAPATILLGAAMVGAAVARTGLRVPEFRSPPDQ